MTYALICEGACNPNIGAVDAAIQAQVLDRYGHVGPLADPLLLAAQRRLRYTAHVMLNGVDARCLDCGHRRRFGVYDWVVDGSVTP